jgi:hypothetical protein
MTEKESSLEENNKSPTNQIPFDSVCTCITCDHGLVRDCIKVKCTCCKEASHSMILDGIEGFPPTKDVGR